MSDGVHRLPQPGDIVAGKYRIESVIGSGGMGIVVRAVHVHLQEPVAMKLLYPEASGNTEAIARFVREARAAARIKSEHVARVTDVGTLENGAPYLVMEYLEGEDLSALLARRGPLPVEETAELVLQACEGLAEAHAMGIVHRDLKPANLFVVQRSDGLPAVKVLDFGISKVTRHDLTEAALTRTTTMMGSPLYMSPEQIRATKSVDFRTDIWALGVILYELLAGGAPFQGETLPDVSVKIAVEPPPPLRSVRPDISPALEAVVMRCLEKDRERRFQNVAELATALADHAPARARAFADRARRVIHAAGLSGQAFSPTVSASGPQSGVAAVTGGVPNSVADATLAPFGRTASPARSRKTLFGLVALGAVAVLAAIGVTVAMTRHEPPVAEPIPSSTNPVLAAPTEREAPRAIEPAPPSVPTPPPPASPSPPASATSTSSATAPTTSPTRTDATKTTPRAVRKPDRTDKRPASSGGLFDNRKL